MIAATVILNLAVAIAVGACLLGLGLVRDRSAWAASTRRRVRAIALAGTLAALLASVVLLWLQAAMMAETPLMKAGSVIHSVLTQTHYGFAWKIGAVALAAAALAMGSGPPDLTPGFGRGSLLALAAFLYSRSMVSHAAADGDIGLAIAVDWIHLMATSAWSGEVIVAGLATLAGEGPRNRVADHVRALSSSATVTLAVVVATGAYSAWHNVGSPANLAGSPYGATLLVKLACVAAAVGLGAFNRFFVMPSVLAGASARRFLLVLRVEGVVLMVVLVLAAMLSSTPPPLV